MNINACNKSWLSVHIRYLFHITIENVSERSIPNEFQRINKASIFNRCNIYYVQGYPTSLGSAISSLSNSGKTLHPWLTSIDKN